MQFPKKYMFAALCVLGLGSCHSVQDRFNTKNNLINAHHISEKAVEINHTPLPIYYHPLKLYNSANSATIYIEGDGFSYITKSKPSSNPTPKTPVALQLALQDDVSSSVFYIARPCQYITKPTFNKKCQKKFWTTHRYSREVIDIFNSTLNSISDIYSIKQFNLVGFSGGGNIAGILAAERSDISSIRTTAGNLDNDFFTRYHDVSKMPYSLNMASYAQKLSNIPQIHFTSNNDKFVPLEISNSYKQKLPHQKCSQFIRVPETTHLYGWQDKWKKLIKIEPICE